MDKFKALAALLLLAALLSGLAGIKMLAAENEELSRRLSETQRINQGLTAELAMNRAALSVREAERKRLAGETDAVRKTLQERYQNDPQAQSWSDTLCPDGLIDCLLP